MSKLRSNGLTVNEQQKLKKTRKYFNLPPSPTPSKRAIVGILILNGVEEVPLISGKHGGPCGGSHRGSIPRGKGTGVNRFTVSHIEGHAASILYQRNLTFGVLLIEKEPCGACDPNIPRMLPPNARLDVVFPCSTSTYWSVQCSRTARVGQFPGRTST